VKANELGISPAPWVRSKHGFQVLSADESRVVCTLRDYPSEAEQVAAASLIAAAPDLYDALTALCEAVDDAMTTNATAVARAVLTARAALTKAKEA